ncbi:hypothetical protein HK104_006615 [Borealophlyctis nickersoniae]|nr:hypothetical protein HK104_006615 [Borealophlyctis nickersoniae]
MSAETTVSPLPNRPPPAIAPAPVQTSLPILSANGTDMMERPALQPPSNLPPVIAALQAAVAAQAVAAQAQHESEARALSPAHDEERDDGNPLELPKQPYRSVAPLPATPATASQLPSTPLIMVLPSNVQPQGGLGAATSGQQTQYILQLPQAQALQLGQAQALQLAQAQSQQHNNQQQPLQAALSLPIQFALPGHPSLPRCKELVGVLAPLRQTDLDAQSPSLIIATLNMTGKDGALLPLYTPVPILVATSLFTASKTCSPIQGVTRVCIESILAE